MPIGTGIVYNVGDLILSQVSSSGTAFLETKIAAATSSLIYFDSTARINSASLNSITVGTASYVSGSNSIITNLTASNISASGTSSFGYVGIGTNSPVDKLTIISGSTRIASTALAGALYFGSDNSNIYLQRDNNYDLSLVQNGDSNSALYLASAGNVYINIDSNNNDTDKAFIVQNNALKAGTELFRVSETGNVGIGTTIPNNKLDMFGGTGTTLNMSNIDDSNRGGKLTFISSSVTGRQFYVGTNSSIYNLVFGIDSIEKMRLDTSGNLGIGTSSPTVRLHVSGSSIITNPNPGANSAVLLVQDDGTATTVKDGTTLRVVNNGSAANFSVFEASSGVSDFVILNNGNVGIGTTSPNSKLEVAGTAGTAVVSVTNSGTGRSGSFGIDNNGVFIRNSSNGDYFDLENATGTSRFRVLYDTNTYINTTFTSVGSLTASGSKLSVFGNLSVGSTYGSTAAPSDGAIFEGNVGIGTTSTTSGLQIQKEGTNTTSGSFLFLNSTNASFGGGAIGVGYQYAAPVGNNYTPFRIRAGETNAIFTINSAGTIYAGDSTGAIAYGNHDPYFAFNQDTNTGMDLAAADTLTFKTGGSEKVRIDSSGNVGIGTTVSTGSLHVYKAAGTSETTVVTIQEGAGGAAELVFRAGNASTNRRAALRFFSNQVSTTTPQWLIGASTTQTNGDDNFYFNNASNTSILTLSQTNVGIGTTVPVAKLQVAGNVSGSSFTSSIGNAVGFLGTSSWAQNVISASYALSSSFATTAQTANALNTGNSYTIAGLTNNGTLSQQGNLSMGSGYQILATTGTAPIPSISFVGNTNTGIFRPTTDTIAFSISGSEKVRIDSTGNVGIGTTNPTKLLQVNGDTLLYANVAGAVTGSKLIFGSFANTTAASIYSQTTTATSGDLIFAPMSASILTEFVRIQSTGNVGIGTSSPSYLLDVYKTSNDSVIRARTIGAGAYLYLDSATDGWYGINLLSGSTSRWFMGGYGTTSFTITRGIGATEYFRIDTAGNVGIGTSTVSTKLAVEGGSVSTVNVTGSDVRYSFDIRTLVGGAIGFNNAAASNVYGAVTGSAYFGVAQSYPIVFTTAGTERMRIEAGGNVGIGTTSPNAKFDVRPDSSWVGSEAVIIDTDGGNNPRIKLYRPDGASTTSSYAIHLRNDSGNLNILNTGVNSTLGSETVTSKFYISTVGNVGVGTTNPVAKLQVAGNVSGSSFTSSISNAVGFLGTSSWAQNVVSASFATTAQTANALNASNTYTIAGLTSAYVDVNGSATIPSTGIYRPSSKTLGLSADATLILKINGSVSPYVTSIETGNFLVQSGNVGIGIANPVQKLHIDGVVGNPATTGTTQNGIFRLSNTTDNAVFDFGMRAGGNGAWIQSTDETSLAVNYSLLLNPNGGNVGIGTTNATDKLTLYGELASYKTGADTIQTQVYLANAGNTRAFNLQLNSGGTGLDLWSYNSANAWLRHTTFNYDGNVGIGTAVPAAKLEISGSSNSALLNIKSPISGAILYVSGSGAVGIGTSNVGAFTLQVSGSFGATTKSFIIDHPTKEGKKLMYGSLESPYHGIRLTGRDTIKDGKCKVELPDYMYKLILHDSINIQLTGIKCNKTLYVDEINIPENYFTIAYDKGVFESYKDYDFFWDFTAIRADVPELNTEL